ncbi:MAG: response regulator [Steroidobacteraceae bacterium]|jgi:DNA-binding NarL/FixJ family response regulator
MHILLVDDHALFRGGLRLLLASLSPEVHFLEAANVEEAVAQAREHQDLRVCLLDLDLKQDHGLPAIGRIRQCAPNAAIVIVSAADDPITVRACIEAGAMSYITKSSPPDLLTLALRRVLDGEVALPRSVLTTSDGAYRARILTPRQRDVLAGLNRGLSTKSIARELSLSEHTVKEYLCDIFRLLEVHNRTEAVIRASQLRLRADA